MVGGGDPATSRRVELNALFSTLSTAPRKGAALESFCTKFFGGIAGLTVHDRNVVDDLQSQELDIVLWNDRGSGLSDLDQILFVEAKNWSKPVGSAEVAWFDWKLRLSGYKHGFLVVMNGITGRADDRTSAWAIVNQANIEKRHLFLLSPEEMLEHDTVDLLSVLIRRKMLDMAARKSHYPPKS